MNWFLIAFKKYATFSGRAQRAEYWYFMLFYIIIFIALSFIDGMMGKFDAKGGIGLLSGIFTLALLLPSLAVTVRRLHDTNRSGWWFLIAIIPILGAIALLVFTIQDGTMGSNDYGLNPKETNSTSNVTVGA